MLALVALALAAQPLAPAPSPRPFPQDYGICEPAYSTGTVPPPSSCALPCHPSSQTCPSQLEPLSWDPATCTGTTPECIRVLKEKPSFTTRLCACDPMAGACADTGIVRRVFANPPLLVLDCP